MSLPDSLPYATLKQRHGSYDEKRMQTLEDLYVGGFQIMRRAEDYLPRLHAEAPVRYKERIQLATYQPYFGQIVDQFTSDLFEKNIEITPQTDAKDKATPGTDTVDSFYTEFARDADGQGNSIVESLRGVLTTALKQKVGLLVVDAPKADGKPANRAEEDAAGLARFYVYELPIECLIDWETDDNGNLLWAIIRKVDRKRASPVGRRDKTTESFTVWSMSDAGKAEWARYAVTYSENEKPKDTDDIALDEAGTTSFDAIPIHMLEVPDGLWCGNKIGPLALEHFRRRTILIGGENRSLCAIPVAALGSEIGAPGREMPSEAQQDPGRGDDPVGQFQSRGYTCTGKDDKIYFAEPTGGCYELVDKQLKELRDDMFAVNHQMAASVRTNSTALGRSGLSKQSDKESTAKVLCALGRLVRQFAVHVYECISTARGEDIRWTAYGLDDYEREDREQLLEEAISVDQVAIPSPTFRKLHKTVLARRLAPNATSQEFDIIRKEIAEGVDAEQDVRDLEHEAHLDEIKNPTEPVVSAPSVKLPMAKVPAAKSPKMSAARA